MSNRSDRPSPLLPAIFRTNIISRSTSLVVSFRRLISPENSFFHCPNSTTDTRNFLARTANVQPLLSASAAALT
jgi:hypothetical protein